MLEVVNVSKYYGALAAVRGVSCGGSSTATSSRPVRRAVRLDPVNVLRRE